MKIPKGKSYGKTCRFILFDKEGNRIVTPKQMMTERYKMVKTNQGYIPTPYKDFVQAVIDKYKGIDLVNIGRCNCGKGKPPKK